MCVIKFIETSYFYNVLIFEGIIRSQKERLHLNGPNLPKRGKKVKVYDLKRKVFIRKMEDKK